MNSTLEIPAGSAVGARSDGTLKTSLGLASQRSYRDEASKRYLKDIGINVEHDSTHPDLVFGIPNTDLLCRERAEPQRVVGLGVKDYASKDWHKPTALSAYRQYLDNMATFVSFLHRRGYAVRLLIGDINYDSQTLTEFLGVLNDTPSRPAPIQAAFFRCKIAFMANQPSLDWGSLAGGVRSTRVRTIRCNSASPKGFARNGMPRASASTIS